MSKSALFTQLHPVLQQTIDRLLHISDTQTSNTPWLLGGSCGLLLQGIILDQPPRDIDLYADSQHIEVFHNRLKEDFPVIDGPEWNETRMYRSLLSHYQADGYTIELVGDFEVRARESYYRVHIDRHLYENAVFLQEDAEAAGLRLMPLAHELVFNLLRDRRDRYEPIAAHIAADPAPHIESIKQIIDSNGFHPQMIQRIYKLCGLDQSS